ncbi:hypothetical protein [Marinomonas sp.]|uniref:hypothetical protein n=1 Tax=Marinomonas sp. TaxID=1904862 RepID=UPI003A9173CC
MFTQTILGPRPSGLSSQAPIFKFAPGKLVAKSLWVAIKVTDVVSLPWRLLPARTSCARAQQHRSCASIYMLRPDASSALYQAGRRHPCLKPAPVPGGKAVTRVVHDSRPSGYCRSAPIFKNVPDVFVT